jgi:hypothetical protein
MLVRLESSPKYIVQTYCTNPQRQLLCTSQPFGSFLLRIGSGSPATLAECNAFPLKNT